jgi:Ca-activated chloride channel family protein
MEVRVFVGKREVSMKYKLFKLTLIALFAGVCFADGARAQGVIVPVICDVRPCRPFPRPLPQPLPRALPVKSIQIDTKINAQVATTHVEQVFRNDTPYTLEGTYFFPIPETASISEFAIWENGKKLVGEVRSREEARRIYDEIVRRQRDPGLLEYAGKNLFQASIFPIPPNSDKKLELTYTEILKAASGTVAYRYPLGTGQNIWRQRMAEESPNRASPGSQQFGTISGSIEIIGKEAIRNIYSPSHSIDVKRKGEVSANVSFETKGGDSDFQLFYGLSGSDFGVSLVTYREPGKDGYFLLMLSPKDNVSDNDLANKDIVFVLDTSGSMAEEGKIEKARKALLFGIRTLRPGDRFNVLNFAGEEHLMEQDLIQADASGKKRGEDFVNRLQPTGGTNINDSLIAAFKQFDKGDRPKMMVFMTDGLPTVGETNIDRILKNANTNRVEGLRLFTFGVGYDVNTRLLDKLAAENSGDADYIEPKEDLEIKVSNFFAKVNSPVLTDIDLDFGGVRTDLVYPRQLKDIFRGAQAMIIGRYKNENELRDITLRLRGKTGRETRTFSYPNLDFPLRSEGNEFLPRLWASRRVGWLVEQIRTNGENKELRDEVVELGTRYGIVTPYTSYLATDGSVTALPTGRRMAQAGGLAPMAAANTAVGDQAVAVSKKARAQKELSSLAESESDRRSERARTIRAVGNKTFYLEGGVWTDSEFKEDSKLREFLITFGSDDYFNIVTKDPELAKLLSLGDQVIVVWKGSVYRIVK